MVKGLLIFIEAQDRCEPKELSIDAINDADRRNSITVSFDSLLLFHWAAHRMGLVKHLKGNKLHNQLMGYLHDHRLEPSQFINLVNTMAGVDDKILDFAFRQTFFQYTKACYNAPDYSIVFDEFDYIWDYCHAVGHGQRAVAMEEVVEQTFREKRKERRRAMRRSALANKT